MDISFLPIFFVFLGFSLLIYLIFTRPVVWKPLKNWEIVGIILIALVIPVWTALYIFSPTKFETKYFKSKRTENVDYIFENGQFINLNKMFGQSVEPNSIIIKKTEIPQYGLKSYPVDYEIEL